MKNSATQKKSNTSVPATKLRRRAETLLRKKESVTDILHSEVDSKRLVHELKVHQIELEMQNAELQENRDRTELLLDKYTDLYDFAPVGYFTLDEQGKILEVNLTGSVLLGIECSRLINRPLLLFVSSINRPTFLAFLKNTFTKIDGQTCEVLLLKKGGSTFWGSFSSRVATHPSGKGKWCRVAIMDITARKQIEETARRAETLAVKNQELRREIVRRQTAEKALKKSEKYKSQLLDQSDGMQKKLRHMTHKILHVQEEERKRISRELHDQIAQNLVGINVHLENLVREIPIHSRNIKQKIARTQRLVGKAVGIMHQFALDLRPTALDDLGLIPALHSHIKRYLKQTGIRTRLTAYKGVEQLSSDRRTILFRVAQEALTNVARHSQANQVDINIQKLPRSVCLTIKDNGKSFQVKFLSSAQWKKQLGLTSMRERVEMVGGNFSVDSAPGQGTTIYAEIPLSKGGYVGGGRTTVVDLDKSHS